MRRRDFFRLALAPLVAPLAALLPKRKSAAPDMLRIGDGEARWVPFGEGLLEWLETARRKGTTPMFGQYTGTIIVCDPKPSEWVDDET